MNCMAKGLEKRFDYSATVYSFKQFLLEKRKTLLGDIATETITKRKAIIARQYVRKINALLRTDYFSSDYAEKKVYELMERLKEEDKTFQAEIAALTRKIREMETCIQERSELSLSSDYSIPDESEVHKLAIRNMKREYKMKIEAVREELRVYQYRLELCRGLKGIIQRPNGFFGAVYKD